MSEEVYLQLYCVGSSTKKDYHGLSITKDSVILNSWDVTNGPHVFPYRRRVPFCDFQNDVSLQNDILDLFGQHVLSYTLAITRGERNLQYLPERVLLYIVRMLAANDILRLKQTSKIFFEICNSSIVWKCICCKRNKIPLPEFEDASLKMFSGKYTLDKNLATSNFYKDSMYSAKRLYRELRKELSEKVKTIVNPIKYIKSSEEMEQILEKLSLDDDEFTFDSPRSVKTRKTVIKKT